MKLFKSILFHENGKLQLQYMLLITENTEVEPDQANTSLGKFKRTIINTK